MAVVTSSREPFFRVFAGILAAIAAFAVADLALVRADRQDRQHSGVALYQEGQHLLQQQRYDEAAARFREALIQQPRTPAYELALFRAFTYQGKRDEAETGFTEYLQRFPTHGEANLLLARTLRARGRTDDAIWYYHRALYGTWPNDSPARQASVRFELADLLASAGRPRDLLAELLPLQDAAQTDDRARPRLAALYLQAQSWDRAAELYRAELRARPGQAAAYVGLGDAETGARRYPQAVRAYASALQHAPERTDVRDKWELVEGVLAGDPTLRGLSVSERERRSRSLLERTAESVAACGLAAETPDLAAARERLAPVKKRPAAAASAASEETDIGLAERLWQQRPAGCSADASLSLLLTELAQ